MEAGVEAEMRVNGAGDGSLVLGALRVRVTTLGCILYIRNKGEVLGKQ